MKQLLLKSITCITFFAALASCSPESDVDLTTDTAATTPERQSRGSVWDGEIGVDHDSIFEITADKNLLIEDLQNIADKQGGFELVTIEILKKEALNNVYETGFMLVATDDTGYSIGVMLNRTPNGLFVVDRGFGELTPNPVAISCEGCATGCNLQYLYIEGKRYPICNENGCGSDCKKSEVEID